MKIPTFKFRLNTNGFTLLEAIVSTLLLSIILLSFFSLLINSAKTTEMSESIVDSTYAVQKEMEMLYGLSTGTPFNKKEDNILMKYAKATGDPEYMEDENGNGNVFIRIPSSSEGIPLQNPRFRLKLSDYHSNNPTIKNEDLNLSKVIIELYDENTLKAKVENTIEWRPDAD